jgi:hypothetical protein
VTREIPQAERCLTDHRRDGGRARRAIDGLRLCQGCYDHLDRALAGLPRLHEELLIAHSRGDGEKVSGGLTMAERTVITDQLVDCRSEITATVRRWARHLAGLMRRTTAPDLAVDVCCRFLHRNLDRLSISDEAGKVKSEITAVYEAASRLAYPDPQRHAIPLDTRCPELDGTLHRCTGTLHAVVHRPDDRLPSTGDPEPDMVQCDLDPEHCWPSREWFRSLRRARIAVGDANGAVMPHG